MTIKKTKKSEVALPSTIGIPAGYSIKEVGTSQTLLLAWSTCRKRWVYMLNKLRNPIKEESTNFGSMTHDVLDKLYTAGSKATSEMILPTIEKYVSDNKDKLALVDQQKLERDIAMCQTVTEVYFDNYKDDFFSKKFTEVEKEISVTIAGFKIHCKIDGRFFDKNKKRWQMEHKTKSRISEESMMKKLSFDTQNLFYILASEEYYKEKVFGVLYNIIRTPQLKVRKDDTLKMFCDRLRDDVNERKDFYFMRYEIPYTEDDKRRALDRFCKVMTEMQNCCEGKQTIFENTSACDSPFACEFLDACTTDTFAGYTTRDKVFTELDTINY
jgi:hypothetical protein